MSDEEIKQIFFHCGNSDPESLYANVDIIEFGRKLCVYAKVQEHQRCVAILKPFNEDAAKLLENGRPFFEWRKK